MTIASPAVVVLGGPNGAGKSTSAARLLRGSLKVEEFVNADTLALGLSAFRPEDVALEAGRITLKRLDDLESRRKSFAFESTLSSHTLARRLSQLRAHGYTVRIVYLWLPTAELAIARVAERVRAGGHDVPAEIVRRRYTRGRVNFFKIYRPLADRWRLYDASSARGPRLVATGGATTAIRVRDRKTWQLAAQEYAVSDVIRSMEELFDDDQLIDEALREAARDARRFHKALGNPIATWMDGRVVWIQPEDIRIDDEDPVEQTSPE